MTWYDVHLVVITLCLESIGEGGHCRTQVGHEGLPQAIAAGDGREGLRR